MPYSQRDLVQAVFDALTVAANGRPRDLGILREPLAFYSYVIDGVGVGSREMDTLKRACEDARYLGFFYDAALRGTSESLAAAVPQASTYLNARFGTDSMVAEGLSYGIASGVAAFYGWQFSYQRPTRRTGGLGENKKGTPSANVGYDSYRMGLDDELTQYVRNDAWEERTRPLVESETVPEPHDTSLVEHHPIDEDSDTDDDHAKPRDHTRVIIVASVALALAVGGMGSVAILARRTEPVVEDRAEVPAGSEGEDEQEKEGKGSVPEDGGGEVGEVVNVTEATLAFDANGADGTPPQDIVSPTFQEVMLPEPESLSRKGYAFGGWGTTEDATRTYAANDSFYVESDTTLYAIWNVLVEESSDFQTSEVAYAADDGGYVAMVFVTNNSDATVDLHATFDFVDAVDKVVETGTDQAWSIGPGDKTLITKQTAKKSVKNARWSIVATPPSLGASSVTALLEASIVRLEDDGADVMVTNTGDEPCWLMFVTLYGRDEQQRFAQQTNLVEEDRQRLDPGSSVVLTYEGDYWQYFANEVYLYGYAQQYDN